MNQLEKKFEGLSVSGWKKCDICDGKYPLQKHNFEECYSLDIDWDLKQMDNITYNPDTFNIGGVCELKYTCTMKDRTMIYNYECKRATYILTFTYTNVIVNLYLPNSNILKLYVILQHHYKVNTIRDLSLLKWDYNAWKISITSIKKGNPLSDHLILLNCFLNLGNKFNVPLSIDYLEKDLGLKIKDKRGIGGERPRELSYMYGFPFETHATNKKIKNSERLFRSPFPVKKINPERKAILTSADTGRCFTCGKKDGDVNIFGVKCRFEKGHLTPITVKDTTVSRTQCKWCNSFYKDKITWNSKTGKPTFNCYAVMRDTKKKELVRYIKMLGITSDDLL
jgi:hypothetical protein